MTNNTKIDVAGKEKGPGYDIKEPSKENGEHEVQGKPGTQHGKPLKETTEIGVLERPGSNQEKPSSENTENKVEPESPKPTSESTTNPSTPWECSNENNGATKPEPPSSESKPTPTEKPGEEGKPSRDNSTMVGEGIGGTGRMEGDVIEDIRGKPVKRTGPPYHYAHRQRRKRFGTKFFE